MSYAIVLAHLGDYEQYREHSETCVRLVQQSQSNDPRQLRLATRVYFGVSLSPNSRFQDEALMMARRSMETVRPGSSAYRFGALSLGMAEYRVGHAAEAIKSLEIAEESNPFGQAPAHAYHALAAVKLGQTELAAEQLAKAEELVEQIRETGAASSNWVVFGLVEMAVEEARAAVGQGD